MKVFVASSGDRLDTAKLLKHELQRLAQSPADNRRPMIEITVWDKADAFRPGTTTIRALEGILNDFDAGIFFVDARSEAVDLGNGDAHRIPSTNVIFELGYMAGAWNRKRTLIVHRRSHAPDKFSDLDGVTKLTYDRSITEIIPDIEQALLDLGPRPSYRKDIGALVRMLNVCTPETDDAIVDSSRFVNHRDREDMDEASELVDLVADTMSDFISPHVPMSGGLRVYFANYLGDGIPSGKSEINHVRTGSSGDDNCEHQFVISFSNEEERDRQPAASLDLQLSETHWRLGQPISVTNSNCVNVFRRQQARLACSGQQDFQQADDEAEVHSIPVLWRQSGIQVSVGVLALSARQRGTLTMQIHEDLRQRLRVLALPIAAAFGRLVGHDGWVSTKDGSDEPDSLEELPLGVKITTKAKARRDVVDQAIEVRRQFASAAVARLISEGRLDLVEGKLIYKDA